MVGPDKGFCNPCQATDMQHTRGRHIQMTQTRSHGQVQFITDPTNCSTMYRGPAKHGMVFPHGNQQRRVMAEGGTISPLGGVLSPSENNPIFQGGTHRNSVTYCWIRSHAVGSVVARLFTRLGHGAFDAATAPVADFSMHVTDGPPQYVHAKILRIRTVSCRSVRGFTLQHECRDENIWVVDTQR